MTLLRPEATLGRQNGQTLFVIPDLIHFDASERVGNPVFLLPPLAAFLIHAGPPL